MLDRPFGYQSVRQQFLLPVVTRGSPFRSASFVEDFHIVLEQRNQCIPNNSHAAIV